MDTQNTSTNASTEGMADSTVVEQNQEDLQAADEAKEYGSLAQTEFKRLVTNSIFHQMFRFSVHVHMYMYVH